MLRAVLHLCLLVPTLALVADSLFARDNLPERYRGPRLPGEQAEKPDPTPPPAPEPGERREGTPPEAA